MSRPIRLKAAGESVPSWRGMAIGWSVIAALTALTQVVLRRELAPGEFGTLNALIGIVLVLLAPMAAFSAVARRELAKSRASHLHLPLINRVGVGWALACVVVLLAALPEFFLPRLTLQFFTIVAVLAGVMAICGRPATPARWCVMIGISAAIVRLLVGGWAGLSWPTAETGLGALIAGALLAGLPALRDQPEEPSPAGTWKILRPALVPGLAAISVAMALALFGNADRIVAHLAFTGPKTGDAGFVDYPRFDEYQSAGLLARFVLWGTIPLLLPFYRQRLELPRTSRASLRWFWIYLAALFVGSVVLVFSAPLEKLLFGGPEDVFLPGFAAAVFLIGLVQAVGIFALASRRYAECLVLGAGSAGYAIFICLSDNPLLLNGCMFGGALVALTLVLFVGVVRYARSHP